MNNYANDIKERVDMRECAERYGYTVSNTGFMCCPFHREHTPSLKIYKGNRGFHCFGCGCGGDVISFTMELHGITFLDACKKLNADFSLGFNFESKNTFRELKKRNKALEEIRARQAEHNRLKNDYEEALDRWARNDYIIINFPLCSDEWHSALNDIEYSKYLLGEAQTALYEYESKERNGAVSP